MPGQPSSDSSRHSASPYARASAASRTFAHGERAASSSRATVLISCWSWVRSKSIAVLSACLGEAEHALGDDVLEHLGGAALDRVPARAQQLVGPAVAGLERRGAEQVGGELAELLVRVRPDPLQQRALGPGLAVLLDGRQAAVSRQAQRLRAQMEVAQAVGDHRVVEQPAPGGLLDERVEQL